MNNKFIAIMFLAIALSITWILMSSIQLLTIQATSSSSGKSRGSNSISGLGGGLGGANEGIGLGRLPSITINLPHKWPSINISIPFMETPMLTPIYKASNSTAGGGSAGMLFITTPLNTLRIPLITASEAGGGSGEAMSGSSGGGGGGSAGSSGGGSQSARGAVAPIIVEVIPWLAYLLIILIVIVLVFSLLSARRGGGGINGEKSMGRKIQEKRVSELKPRDSPQRRIPSDELKLMGKPVQLRGWGGGKLIKLGIDGDLPLSWRINDPLNYTVEPGVSLSVLPEGEVGRDSIIFRSGGCHEIRARRGSEEESHRVWVVNNYSIDVIDSFHANMIAHGAMAEETPREACLRFGVECLGWGGLRVFEEARYGGYPIDRGRYEYFLRELARLRDALVMGCE